MSLELFTRKRKIDNMGPLMSKTCHDDDSKAEEATSSTKTIDEGEVKTDDEPSQSKKELEEDLNPKCAKMSKNLPLDDTPETSPEPSPVKKEAAADTKEEENEKEEKKGHEDIKVDKIVKKQSSSSSLRRERKKTMADMGYHFKDGQLRTIDGDESFTFTTQKAYEELGDLIGDVVYEMMEEAGLEKRYLEVNSSRRFYFVSPGYEQKERILVLVHGSGVVKAGQWARKLIINESLSRGTQLDYIKRGLALGWGIVVLNYNEKCEGRTERCHSPDAHGVTEWRHALDPAGDMAEVFVVAHSYGGSVVSEAVRRMLREDDCRVVAVALTDSWFSEGKDVPAVNFNTMKKKLHRTNGTWQMYSGDDTHEGTSAACINAVFSLLQAVNYETTMPEFLKQLEISEQIVLDDYKERMRKKREDKGETSSAKSVKMEEEKKEEKEKEVKKEEEDAKENEEKKEKEEVTDQGASGEKTLKEENADEKKEEKGVQVGREPLPQRNPSDNEESDEGVEKDGPSSERSDVEN